MLRIQRIVHATDLSESSDRAFLFAVHLANRFDAVLHLVNVVETEGDGERMEGILLTPAEIAERLDGVPVAGSTAGVAALVEGTAIEQAQLLHRDRAQAILAYADQAGADLIVLGLRRRGPVERLLPGHVAETVVREAPCPVWTVHDDRKHPLVADVGRILVTVDLTDHSVIALTHAVALAEHYGARLEVLHVVDEEEVGEGEVAATGEAESELERLVATVDGAEAARRTVLPGKPLALVVAHAREAGADLIVIATHGLRGVQRTVMGSMAEDIVGRAPCPVLTVRRAARGIVAREGV